MFSAVESSPRGPEHARKFRERKRQLSEEMGIDAEFISTMVEEFYAKIRQDRVLGSIFEERVTDWPVHLERMKTFWRSVLHSSGEYSGSPMQKHLAIPGLAHEHFERWLMLFRETVDEIQSNRDVTEHVHERARMIAKSLLHGIAMNRAGSGVPNLQERS